jgi:CHASE3 domain sensor protein
MEGGTGEMANDEWMRALVERIDLDRRESEQRQNERLQRIEHLMETTRSEILQQNSEINRRIDQAYAHFQQNSNAVRWCSIATIISLAILVTGVMLKG